VGRDDDGRGVGTGDEGRGAGSLKLALLLWW
jgi:hypothetical protein